MKKNNQKNVEQDKESNTSGRTQRLRKPTEKCLNLMSVSSTQGSHTHLGRSRQGSAVRPHLRKSGKTERGCVRSRRIKHVKGLSQSEGLSSGDGCSSDLTKPSSALFVQHLTHESCTTDSNKQPACPLDTELTSHSASDDCRKELEKYYPFCNDNKSNQSNAVSNAVTEDPLQDDDLLHSVSSIASCKGGSDIEDKNVDSVFQETTRHLDVSETFITIETKDGLSSEKIPFSHFLKKVTVDQESGNLKVDLGQLLGSYMPLSTEFNSCDNNTNIKKDSASLPVPSCLQTNSSVERSKQKQTNFKEPGNHVSEKPMKRRGRPPKNKQLLPVSSETHMQDNSAISKSISLATESKTGNNPRKNCENTLKATEGFSHSPRRSGRTPARSSRFGDDFVDSITLGKIASSTSTWNTQLMTLALAAETHKNNKQNKASTSHVHAEEQHEVFENVDDDSDYSPDKETGDSDSETGSRKISEYASKRFTDSSIKNTLEDKGKKAGNNCLRGPKTLKKYEPVEPVVKHSLQDALNHTVEATNDMLSAKIDNTDFNTEYYYTIMEPKLEANGNGLLVQKLPRGMSFKMVNFTGNLESGDQFLNFSKSYPQDRYFSCDLCENVFPSTNSWLQHNRYIHDRTIDSFEKSVVKTGSITEHKCEFCEQKFPYKFMLDIHIKRKRHSEVKTFRCTLCKESFATHKAREEHWIISHPARSCGLCGKQFTNIVMLRRHINHNCHGARFRQMAAPSEGNTEIANVISKQTEMNFNKDVTEDDEDESEDDDDLEKSAKGTDVEDCSDDIVEDDDASDSNVVKNESGKVECDHCGMEFSTYSGLWYHKLDEHREYYPHGHRDRLKEKLEKNETILQNAQDADLCQGAEASKNGFFVILKPKWPPNKSKLSVSVEEKEFVFKPGDEVLRNDDSLSRNSSADASLKKETSFKCMQCNETFQLASNYREHRSRIHGECFEVVKLLGAFQCTLCSETYPCQFMLDKHLKKHVGKKLLPCTLCGLFFHKIQERRMHWKIAHPGIGCPNCGKMYASIKYLQKHIALNCQDHFPPTKKFLEFQKKQLSDFDMPKNEKKVEKKIIQCHLCPKLCSSVHGWRRHMSEAHEDAGFSKLSNTCIICNELVYGYKALEKHLLQNHAVESGLPVEEEDGMVEEALRKCEMDITAYRKAGKNNADIYQDEKGNYHCPSCPKTHTDLRALRTHIRIHVNMKLECSICNKTFKNPTLLKQHVQRHRKDAVYSCDSCSKKFLTLQKLNKHRKVHHCTGNFVCDLCGMSFALNDYLQKHKRCHTDQRPHCCTICGKTFRTKPELRVHVLIHTRETPYKCQFCGRGFSQKGNYRIHLAQHTGEKPYQCDRCDISFALLCHLKRHKITHDQKINYRCMWCDKECTQRKHMQMHVHRVHKEDFYQYEEQMKLEAPVPIAPSQVKLYNRRLGKMNKVRKQYRTRAQKCDSTIQQLMNGIITKAEPMDEDTEQSQNIVIEPIVEPMMETVTCDMPVAAHESEAFEILVSEDHQNYAKHAIPVDLIGQDPSNVEIVMGENNEINIIIKDPNALQGMVGDHESLAQLSGGHVDIHESLQHVVEALVTHAKTVCDEDGQLIVGICDLDKSALAGTSQILPFDSN